MTIDKLKKIIEGCHVLHCYNNCNVNINNLKNIITALNAVDELVATLQPTPINDLCLYKEAIVKGKICATYDSNYIEDGKEFKATMVELLIKHEE
jgi:hypothetical protein